MVIKISDTFTHEASHAKKTIVNQEKVKDVVCDAIQKLGIDPSVGTWNEHGQLEINCSDGLKLHTLLLQMEEMGLDLKMTKQTLIEIN